VARRAAAVAAAAAAAAAAPPAPAAARAPGTHVAAALAARDGQVGVAVLVGAEWR